MGSKRQRMRWDYNLRHGAAVPHPLLYMQVFLQIHLHQILHNQSLKGPTKTKVFYILIFLLRTQLSQTLGIFELMTAVIHRTPKHNCILHSLLHYLSNSLILFTQINIDFCWLVERTLLCKNIFISGCWRFCSRDRDD